MNQPDSQPSPYVIVGLAAFTALATLAMPVAAMPVLFAEIAADLNITIFQLGVIWGTPSLAALFLSLPTGTLGDRFGTRPTLTAVCLLLGAVSALRGLATGYASFLLTTLLYSLVAPAVVPNILRAAGLALPARRGVATGIVSAGFALGFMLSSAFSATTLSPWLGGWRNVIYFYSVITALTGLLWLALHPRPRAGRREQPRLPIFDSIRHVAQRRELWLIGGAVVFFMAGVRGFIGYLPLYLRGIGWAPERADQALALFFALSLIGVMPLSIASDRLQIRRGFLLAGVLLTAVGFGLLAVVEGALIWVAIIIAGAIFDGFMAIHQAAVLDIPAVTAEYVGAALGLIASFREVGGFLGPPLGNSLATIDPSLPFAFWALCAGLSALFLIKLPRAIPAPD